MPTTYYTVHGLKELERLLENFPGRLASTVVRRALADAAKIGRSELKDEAAKHDDKGEMRVNLRTLRRRVAHLSDQAMSVSRRYGGQEYIAIGFQWPEGAAGWLVEHGHRMVTGGTIERIASGKAPKARVEGLTGAGRVVGFVKPHPIAAPAFERARPEMEGAFTARIEKEAGVTAMEQAFKG